MEASKYSDGNSSSSQNIRCHHCTGSLSKDIETSDWTVTPLIRDSFSMIGSSVGGTASACYGFNRAIVMYLPKTKADKKKYLLGSSEDSSVALVTSKGLHELVRSLREQLLQCKTGSEVSNITTTILAEFLSNFN